MVRALATLFLLFLNLLVFGIPVVIVGIAKFAVHMTAPRSRLRTRIILLLSAIAEQWVAMNTRIFDWMLPTRWEVSGVPEAMPYDGRYLIIANHVSWVDIFTIFRVFHRKAAFVRFFLKQRLIFFPVVGQACWALEFPFMRRYTPEHLERHPEKRGTDLETTRRLCRRYRRVPMAILNFVEGTRFSREKHAEQESPYRHLLRPRIGGISFVLASLGDQLDAIFDVTLAYPKGDVTMWEFVTDRVPRVIVRARRLDVTPELIDPNAREYLKEWIDDLWRHKDTMLDSYLGN